MEQPVVKLGCLGLSALKICGGDEAALTYLGRTVSMSLKMGSRK
ncbi:hypothetical protein COLO4_15174 [Corchorus olitorius]|uniref:Uncharacterized protein n=1 Tax=Corchorus olitorius TaxID=93759 RepID=A0A1R3JP73_9ROSI|nr:hypothetical protein COLO4_15174 [Corchorus olitorius]